MNRRVSKPVLIAALFAPLVLAACSAQQLLSAIAPKSGYSLFKDVRYGDAPEQSLDLYRPEQANGAPVVIFFHGGRWREGSKDEYGFVGQALAAKGFVAVLPNVRKYPAVRFPEFVRDGARAVRWSHDLVARYGGDPDKLFVMGHSSGAHIAALLALDPSYLGAEGGDRSWVRGMIGLAGPYDFMPITAPDLRDLFGPPERFERSQPVNFCDGKNPPVLLMHGTDDETVEVENTMKLKQAIVRSGGAVETVIYPKMSHGWIVATLSKRLSGGSDVLDHVTDFVRRRSQAQPEEPQPLQTRPLEDGQ